MEKKGNYYNLVQSQNLSSKKTNDDDDEEEEEGTVPNALSRAVSLSDHQSSIHEKSPEKKINDDGIEVRIHSIDPFFHRELSSSDDR